MVVVVSVGYVFGDDTGERVGLIGISCSLWYSIQNKSTRLAKKL